MSNEIYKKIGEPLTRLMEECSEVIQISCKIQRFGWHNFNPYDLNKTPNYQLLLNEIADTVACFNEIKQFINNKVADINCGKIE